MIGRMMGVVWWRGLAPAPVADAVLALSLVSALGMGSVGCAGSSPRRDAPPPNMEAPAWTRMSGVTVAGGEFIAVDSMGGASDRATLLTGAAVKAKGAIARQVAARLQAAVEDVDVGLASERRAELAAFSQATVNGARVAREWCSPLRPGERPGVRVQDCFAEVRMPVEDALERLDRDPPAAFSGPLGEAARERARQRLRDESFR